MSAFLHLKNKIMSDSRKKKLDHFYELCGSDSKILDVGVSWNEHNEAVNLFLHNFRLKSNQYTGLAVQSMKEIRKKHPDKEFIEYPGGKFPFEDNQFDWAFSNAVVEHVGDREDQLLFINEMTRVCKNVFFTTPNKYFPVEAHTYVYFIHWFDKIFYNWCNKNSEVWSRENLLLFGYKDLKNMLKSSNVKEYTIYKNRSFLYPMTFTVVCHG